MTNTASDEDGSRDPGRPVASPSGITVHEGDTDEWIGPDSADDALNMAKLKRLTARRAAERHNASDYDMAIAEQADRESQTYALLSIAESLLELVAGGPPDQRAWATCDHPLLAV